MDPVGVLNVLLDVICSPECFLDIVVDPVGVTGLPMGLTGVIRHQKWSGRQVLVDTA